MSPNSLLLIVERCKSLIIMQFSLSRALSSLTNSQLTNLLLNRSTAQGISQEDFFSYCRNCKDIDTMLLKKAVDYYRSSLTPSHIKAIKSCMEKALKHASADQKVGFYNSMLLNKIIEIDQITADFKPSDIPDLSTQSQVTFFHLLLASTSGYEYFPYFTEHFEDLLLKLDREPRSTGVFLQTYLRLCSVSSAQEQLIYKCVEANMWSFIPKHTIMILAAAPIGMKDQLSVMLYPLLEVYCRYDLWYGIETPSA